MKTYLIALTAIFFAFAPAQPRSAPPISHEMAAAVRTFVASLDADQRKLALFAFDSDERFDWHFVPRERKGLPLKKMTEKQRQVAFTLLKTALSEQGYTKATSIMRLDSVLRFVENRGPSDSYRDPENYSFSVFGEVSDKEPWGWRVEGHHLSLQFSSLTGRVIGMTPTFMGSNPGIVQAEIPQKGRQVLKQETQLALALVKSLQPAQLKQALINEDCPADIFTSNKRRAALEKQEGLSLSEMTEEQRKTFLALLDTYLSNYHITLKNQQMDKLKKAGLDKLTFAWAGDREAGYGRGHGHYYRIHGPTILIEYDNTQNNANHVHTVVRDLTSDFGEDMLAEHYKAQHK